MIVVLGCIVVIGHVPVRIPAGVASRLLGLGFVNVLADLLYLLATRRGLLSLVAVVTSMYPAATVILARLILSERMAGQQVVGLAMAALSVVLIASG
jgi:drug/metabolite transporter (DMT)-like permease